MSQFVLSRTNICVVVTTRILCQEKLMDGIYKFSVLPAAWPVFTPDNKGTDFQINIKFGNNKNTWQFRVGSIYIYFLVKTFKIKLNQQHHTLNKPEPNKVYLVTEE